jgi:hypothetical protein
VWIGTNSLEEFAASSFRVEEKAMQEEAVSDTGKGRSRAGAQVKSVRAV